MNVHFRNFAHARTFVSLAKNSIKRVQKHDGICCGSYTLEKSLISIIVLTNLNGRLECNQVILLLRIIISVNVIK